MDPKIPTRRQVAAGITVAAAAAAAAPAARAQGGQPQTVTPAAPPNRMQNPLAEFPKPPFPAQKQAAPGLQGQMHPIPDCGEASYRGSGKLAGRRALVTGGDSGIGRAAAIAFAREGADVAIAHLPVEEPDAREVVALIRNAGRKGVSLPGDIRDEAFCRQLVADAVRQLGGLDILVNNAGHQQYRRSIEEMTTQDFDDTFKTNVYAMFWITKAAMPHFRPGSAIVNTASVEAFHPSPILLDYAQTKACIVAFTKSLAQQVAERGIRVNAVAPGPFWTPLQVSGGQPTSAVEKFGAQTPYGRPGQPAELAPLYVTLASQDASYCSGQVFGGSGGTGVI